ncbi:MAG: PAS domain S-box protein [Gammaproteobacteria bacterium]|nr:PAS domain S-box protein [Gammaproteobacteria bacterium]
MNNRSWPSWLGYQAVAAVAAIAILTPSGYIVWEARQTARADAETSVVNTAGILAVSVAHALDQIDAWLQSISLRHQQLRALEAQDVQRLQAQLAHEVRLHPLAERLAISDAAGTIVFNTGAQGSVDISDRAYFQRALAGAAGPIFSDVLQSRARGDWVIIMARRLQDTQGRFAGVALAVLPVETLGRSFAGMNLGPRDLIGLRAADWTPIVRRPAPGGADHELDEPKVFATLQDRVHQFPDSHVEWTRSSSDGIKRIYAYRRVGQYPFYILVGRAAADASAGWRHTAILVAMLSLAMSSLLLLGARRLQRRRQALEHRVQARTADLAAARAELEQALAQTARSEARFRTMVEQAPLGIALTDSLNGQILEVNDRFVAITGRAREEMIHGDWMQITHPDDLPAELENMARLNAGQIAGFQMDKRYVRPDGSLVWISVTIARVRVVADERPRHLALIEDISERKRLQAALADSEARYRLAVDAASAALWDVHFTTGEQVFNDHWYRLHGYAIGEVEPSYACWRSHLYPDDLPMIDQAIEACVQGLSSSFDLDYRVTTKTGALRWHRAIGRVISRDADGRALRMIGSTTDITERVEAQQRIQETLKLLKLAQEAADIGVWTWELKTGTLTWDARLYDWYEVPQERRSGGLGYRDWETRVHPDDRVRAAAELDASVRVGAPYDCDFRLLLADGHIRHIHAAAIIDRDAEGKPWRMVGINRDISAQWQLEDDLRTAKAAADAANRAKSAFLATMSHEIRTPLNAIIGTAYLLGKGALDPDQQRDLNTIEVSSKHLLALINDILDVSKIEAGELALDRHAFSLPELLQDLRALFSADAARKGIALEIPPLPQAIPPLLVGDGNRLRQMLVNLLGNALKFTEQGRVALEVTPLGGEPEGTQARLRFLVTDTGIGMGPELQTRLFTPFFQADASTSRHYGGTGLGLSIVKRLADLMGGTLGVESHLAQGARFWLELPFEVSAEAPPAFQPAPAGSRAQQVPAAPDGRALSDAPLAGLRVLAVDDSRINLQVIERILANAGALPSLCLSGEDAVALLTAAADDYDAVLMDLQMPGMDGCDTTRTIRERLQLQRLPIIALTAGATVSEEQRAMDAAMDAFLTKPVEPDQLVRVLRQQVERHREEPLQAGPDADAAPRPSAPTDFGATETAWPTIAGIDAAKVVKTLGGDLDFFRELLGPFLADNSDAPQAVRRLLQASETAQAAKRVHKLRGQAGHLGATALHQAAGALEEAIQVDAPDIGERLDAFAAAHAELFEGARAWLDRHQ